jgi:glycerol kinase
VPGVELEPLEIVAGAFRAAGLTGRDLAAIGIANQRETAVLWNPRTGRPWPAGVWADRESLGRLFAFLPLTM